MARSYEAKPTFLPFTTQELDSLKKIIDEAQNQEVSIIVNVGTDIVESKACIELAQKFPACYAVIGLHPTDASLKTWKQDIKTLSSSAYISQEYVIGIGECGIDRYHKGYDFQLQKAVFQAQIELALQHKLPLIVHSRDAVEETLECLLPYTSESSLKGIIHCYSYNLAYAQEFIKYNFVLGIGGTITYPKNNSLREVVQTIPLEKIVLETDAPFLPPQNIRGHINNPAQIKTIAGYIADLKNITLEAVALKTTTTAQQIFNFTKEIHV
jgi:TatD DNase family protein